MEPLLMPTFGALAALRQRPRNTQGPACASRPAWSPLAPRPPFPLLPDTWLGSHNSKITLFSLNFCFLNSF